MNSAILGWLRDKFEFVTSEEKVEWVITIWALIVGVLTVAALIKYVFFS